jgi:hypothetical protein
MNSTSLPRADSIPRRRSFSIRDDLDTAYRVLDRSLPGG